MENRQMARLFRRQFAIGASLVAGALLASTATVEAQGRMRVLVPAFENEQGATTRNGQRLADQVRRQIDALPTHAPLEERAWKDALRKHSLREGDMDCIKWQQLARVETAMNAALVMCGTYNESTGQVTGQFFPAAGGDAFEVPPFAFESQQQVAQHIVEAFQTYTRQLSLVQYCDEHIRSQNWQQALDTCNQAVELNPRSTSANYARGSALLQLERPEEALAAFQMVLEADPINTDALLAAGYTAAQLRQQDVSQRYLREYLAMNPGDVQVRLSIATELANQGDPSGALRLVEEVATGEDATAQMFTYAGHFAMNAGLSSQQATGPAGGEASAGTEYFRKAVSHYERAISMQPDSVEPQVRRQLMLAYKNVGNVDKALELGQQIAASGEDAAAMSIYAEVLKDAGRVDDAIAALDRAAQIDPTTPNLSARKGLLLLDAGRLSDATAAFKQAISRNEMQAAQAEGIAQQMAVSGFNITQRGNFEQALPYFAAAREIGKSERTVGMINFFHGYTLLKQGEPIIRNGNNAAAGRRAKPLFERAKTLLESSAAYTEQAALRAQFLADINQFIEVADALIRAGR
jgi:tetratricopeptide (TPR) repeat protein